MATEDSSSPQRIYATNLPQNIGYPLRNPKPDDDLGPPYTTHGFQVGDVGYVEDNGQFNRLFNIRFPPERIRAETPEIGERLVEELSGLVAHPLAIPRNKLFFRGVKQITEGPRVERDYGFTATSTSGALLILPDGATLSELKKKYLEDIRELVMKSALAWCKYAEQDSLYLITTVHTTRDWILGSFYEGFIGGEIFVHHQSHDEPDKYKWKYQFPVDHGQSPRDNCDTNQTVFIKGFKMTVRWKWLPVVQELERTERKFARVLATLRSILRSREWLFRKNVQPFPAQNLTQPHHVLDIINRISLDKNPGAEVAVAHDNDWIDMHDRGLLSFGDMSNEHALRVFIEKNYTWDSNSKHNVVYLRRNSESTRDGPGLACDPNEGIDADYDDGPSSEPNKPDAEDECEPRGQDTLPSSSRDESRLVITNIRLEDFDIDHIDAGVCVILQSKTMTRRTMNKPHMRIIEWDEEIVLPADPQVNAVVCGVFQLGSIMGTRETSTRQAFDTETLTGGIHKLRLPLGNAGSRSSLLITLGRHFASDEPHGLSLHKNSQFEEKTSHGFKAFYAHRDDPEKGYLETAVECFRSALAECDPGSPDRATGLFNLACTEFIRCQANGSYSELSRPIELYREALALLDSDHPDRPATLLLLAQALLFRHGQRYDDSLVSEIQSLLAEIHHDGSRERQTADAITHTCRFYDTIKSGDLDKVDELFRDYERGAYMPPYGYFDWPQMLYKLGDVLWRRFQLHGDLDDLDKSICLNEEALRLIPEGHHDHANVVTCLGNSYLKRIQAREELTDVDMSVGLTQHGEMVLAKLDELTSGEGIGVPLERLREQIGRISESDRVAGSLRSLGPTGRIPQIRIPMEEWSKEDGPPKKSTRQLGVLLSFLGGEGEVKMRELLGNLKWPFKDRMIEDTTHFLEEHIPYFDSIVAIKLRCLMGGWCVTEHFY